jgi:hypothetical protein
MIKTNVPFSNCRLPTKDDINLGNIILHKSVKSKIPPYYKDQFVPIISYVYTRPITSKMFYYKHVLLHFNIDKGPKDREPRSINWKHNFKIPMDSVEDYARQWARREKEDLDTLSEWVKSVRSLIQILILKNSVGL